MQQSKTLKCLIFKIIKIVFLVLFVRLGHQIPIPHVSPSILLQKEVVESQLYKFVTMVTGGHSFGIGSLGILPYLNSSILLQFLVSAIPSLNESQKEDPLGQQKIDKYNRYLTFIWSTFLAMEFTFIEVKPLILNWTYVVGLQISLSLVTGSILSMWFCELIEEERLGTGTSLLIFTNVVANVPINFIELNNFLFCQSPYLYKVQIIIGLLIFYFFFVSLIVLFQNSFKNINLISSKQVFENDSDQNMRPLAFEDTYIPFKLNQNGVMPIVLSTGIVNFIMYSLLTFVNLGSLNSFADSNLIQFFYIVLTTLIAIPSSYLYSVFVLKPSEISENLTKLAYSIPGIRQGNDTTKYIDVNLQSLAVMEGVFLSFLAFFPLILDIFLPFNPFKGATSLVVAIGVSSEFIAQIRGYLVDREYEIFDSKK